MATSPEGPTWTLTISQARSLSDALDCAARTAARDNNGTCAGCGRPHPSTALDARGGLCLSCYVGQQHPVPATRGEQRPEPAERLPEDPEDHRTARVHATHGDKSTRAEVVTFVETPTQSAQALVRARLGGDGYMTASGARQMAALLLNAADDLDGLDERPAGGPSTGSH